MTGCCQVLHCKKIRDLYQIDFVIPSPAPPPMRIRQEASDGSMAFGFVTVATNTTWGPCAAWRLGTGGVRPREGAATALQPHNMKPKSKRVLMLPKIFPASTQHAQHTA